MESNDSPAVLDRGRKNQTSLVSLWGSEMEFTADQDTLLYCYKTPTPAKPLSTLRVRPKRRHWLHDDGRALRFFKSTSASQSKCNKTRSKYTVVRGTSNFRCDVTMKQILRSHMTNNQIKFQKITEYDKRYECCTQFISK